MEGINRIFQGEATQPGAIFVSGQRTEYVLSLNGWVAAVAAAVEKEGGGAEGRGKDSPVEGRKRDEARR